MENTSIFRARGSDALCAVYDMADRSLLAKPEARSPLKPPIEYEYLYVSLGVDAILASDWERFKPTIKGIIETNIPPVALSDDISREQLVAEALAAEQDVFEMLADHATPLVSATDESDVDNIVIDYPDDGTDTASISLLVANAEKREMATVTPQTPDNVLEALAQHTERQFSLVSDYCILDVHEALGAARDRLRYESDQWGDLSPYLEKMLAESHPQVRLKSAGKYNPDQKRVILLHVRPWAGEGGWEPAVLDESDDACRQWRSAGLTYPAEMSAQAAKRKTREVLNSMRQQRPQDRDGVEADIHTLIAQQREIDKQLAERQTDYRNEVAHSAYQKVLAAVGSVRCSVSLNDDGRHQITSEAFRQIGVSIEKLALLPHTVLDKALLRRLHAPIGYGRSAVDHISDQCDAADRLLFQLTKACDDSAIAVMNQSLAKMSAHTTGAAKRQPQ